MKLERATKKVKRKTKYIHDDYELLHDYEYSESFASGLGSYIINKLGAREDIEDELGIDLVTLVDALTYGVWLKNGNKLEHHKVFLCNHCGTWALGYCWEDKYGLQGWCLETQKYKQHWALTKEELEND